MSKNHLKQAESLVGHYKPINIDTAYTMLYSLGQHDTDVIMKTSQGTQFYTTPRQIYSGTSYGSLAEKIKIIFYGGPVGHGKWYKGTLYSFVLDCVASKIQMEGFAEVRRLLRAN